MSRHWQDSWIMAMEYWREHWRSWLPVAIVTSVWLWIVLLAVPALTPFVLMQFEQVNDKTVVRTYHHELTTLLAHVPLLLAMVVVTGVIGGVIVSRMVSRVKPRLAHLSSMRVVLFNALALGLAFLAMAAIQVPMAGAGHPALDVALRGVGILVIFVLGAPWLFWQATAVGGSPGGFLGNLRQRPWDVFFLAWTWLITLVMIQMVAASFAWTTTVNGIGTLILAAFTVASSMIHQSTAYYYNKPDTVEPGLKKSS